MFLVFLALYSLIANDVSHGAEAAKTYSNVNDVIDFDYLQSILETANLQQQTNQKRSCRLHLHSHTCALLEWERLRNDLQYLKSGASPGKRNIELSDSVPKNERAADKSRAELLLSDILFGQRRTVSDQAEVLQEMKPNSYIIETVKRDCRFRLGGHCLTEALDRAATQYYYLKSPDSPGRRRRHIALPIMRNRRDNSLY